MRKGAGGEIQLTDGIARLMGKESVYAYRFEGKRFDCGNKLGYLQATVEFGLNHATLGEAVHGLSAALDGLDHAALARRFRVGGQHPQPDEQREPEKGCRDQEGQAQHP